MHGFISIAGLVSCLLLGLAPGQAAAQDQEQSPSDLDVSGWPAEIQKGHVDFVNRCGECHELKLSLNKHYAPRTWRKYIVRMMKKEESGLDPAVGRSIYRFLTFYGRNRAGLPQKPAPKKPVVPAPPAD